MDNRSELTQKRLLAFVLGDYDSVALHVDKEGIDILIRSLQRIKNDLEKGEPDHEHLMSEEWGGWELSISDEAINGKGRPIHHVKIYGWTDEWAEKHGFDRTIA